MKEGPGEKLCNSECIFCISINEEDENTVVAENPENKNRTLKIESTLFY